MALLPAGIIDDNVPAAEAVDGLRHKLFAKKLRRGYRRGWPSRCGLQL
jgi:hypothetical protein